MLVFDLSFVAPGPRSLDCPVDTDNRLDSGSLKSSLIWYIYNESVLLFSPTPITLRSSRPFGVQSAARLDDVGMVGNDV